MDYNAISHGSFRARLRNKSGTLNSEACKRGFHSHMDIKERVYVGNWKLQVKNISELLFADDMIMYIDSSKDSIRKLLELISKFCKVAGYKINTQK